MSSADSTVPGYVDLYRTGELTRRAEEAVRRLSHCVICAQACNVNRLEGELGFCRTGRLALVSSVGRHFGEGGRSGWNEGARERSSSPTAIWHASSARTTT